MDYERCHVTVMGARRRADIAVPANAAIAEYIPTLLRLVDQVELDDTFPPVWSLALPGARPFPPDSSLRECGVTDGAALYLSDFAVGELDEPVVRDLEETVERAGSGGTPWGRQPRAQTSVVLGALGLMAGLAALVRAYPGRPDLGGAAIVVAFVLASLGRQAVRKDWSLPEGVRLLLALSTLPLLALAAVSLPTARDNTGNLLVALSTGAMLGAVTAVAAVRHATTLMALAFTVLIVPLTVGLVVGRANLLESAAVCAVVLRAVLAVAPKGAGHLAVTAVGHSARSPADEAAIARLVDHSRRLLVGTNLICSVLLGACLVVLGTADQAAAISLAVVLGLGLVLCSGQLTVLPAVVPVACAGTVGMLTALLHGPAYLGAPGWAGPVVALLCAAASVGLGLSRAVRRVTGEEERPSWVDPLAAFLALACVPLAVGVFGVYSTLVHLGRSI